MTDDWYSDTRSKQVLNEIKGTLILLEVMVKYGVKKFVFSSSATVYGPPQRLPVDEPHQVGVGITNPYGRTKYFIEEILRDLVIADPEWKVTLLRLVFYFKGRYERLV